MSRRVPVLRQDHGTGPDHPRVDTRDDLVAVGHGQRTTGAKVVLHIDDDQGVVHGAALLHSARAKGRRRWRQSSSLARARRAQ